MEKIGIVSPTRGDRKQLFEQCKKYVFEQTLKPDHWSIVDYPPKSRNKDLVERCEAGIKDCLLNDCDLIFFIEDDDYYSPIYLEYMFLRWKEVGKPELLGIHESIYYHLQNKKYWITEHKDHSSLMCTMITKDAAKKIDYSKVKSIWFDIYLWKNLKGVTTHFNNRICLGIKHGIGVTGGIGHNKNASIYRQTDYKGELLKEIVGIHNYNFYNDLF